MKCLNRNKQLLYYATYTSKTEVLVSSTKTGEYTKTFSNPIALNANIAPATGTIIESMFGLSVNADKVIAIDDTSLSINEATIFWIDTLPTLAEDGSTDTPHDYALSAPPAVSLNSVSYAVEKVAKS